MGRLDLGGAAVPPGTGRPGTEAAMPPEVGRLDLGAMATVDQACESPRGRAEPQSPRFSRSDGTPMATPRGAGLSPRSRNKIRPTQEDKANGVQASQLGALPGQGGVRSALRAELLDLLQEGGDVRRAVRSEVEAALESWGGGERGARGARIGSVGEGPREEDGREAPVVPRASLRMPSDGTGILPSDRKTAGSPQSASLKACPSSNHISKLVKDNARSTVRGASYESSIEKSRNKVFQRAQALLTWLQGFEEPHRTGCLARLVNSYVFEAIVGFVILSNCAFMMYIADVQIKSPHEVYPEETIGEWFFQLFYTVEMVMKLIVHRHWFFCNSSWKVNTFDFVLVASGFISLIFGSLSGGVLRVLRLLKIGKAMRSVKVMEHSKHLRGFILCLVGSLWSLSWSLIMLFSVYTLFSLFLVDIVVSHLQETGEVLEETAFANYFGSIEESILTLYKASTGGDDWSLAYNVIQLTGNFGAALYLFFIAFVQFALINIITGIFVESAMSTLKPDSQMLARENTRKEHETAKMLDNLCAAVDVDGNRRLTRQEFEDALQRRHITMLLAMLGLPRHHLLDLFAFLAESDVNGQVAIDTFVDACMLLKGPATNFDLQKVHAELTAMHTGHDKDISDIKKLLRSVPRV